MGILYGKMGIIYGGNGQITTAKMDTSLLLKLEHAAQSVVAVAVPKSKVLGHSFQNADFGKRGFFGLSGWMAARCHVDGASAWKLPNRMPLFIG